MMRLRTFVFALALAAPVMAQTTPARVSTAAAVPLSLQDAERRAVDRNPGLAYARLGTEGADFASAETRAAYSPTFVASLTERSQTNPSTTQLSGGQTSVRSDAASYSTGVSQLVPWGGLVSLDFTGSRSATSSIYSTYNPSFASAVAASISQPLLRGLRFDATRAAIAQADISRGIADVELRQETATLLAGVRRAYWELVYTVDALATAQRSEALAVRQRDDNQRRVDLGTVAPIDVLESEAEVASRHQASVQAEGAWRDAQVALKALIVANATDAVWKATIVPTDRPAESVRAIDLPQAISKAVANRTDLDRARRVRQSSDVSLRLFDDQRKPAVDLVGGYTLSGIGGTQVLRSTTSLGSEVIGTVSGSYWDVLQSIGGLSYPTWTVGVSVTMPIGNRAANARYAQADVARKQVDAQLASLELRVTAAVTRAAQQVRSAEEQVKAASAARALAARRLEAEQARRDVGLSTTFFVLQAQRDLATAETNELRAQLDYGTALADFDLAQEAPAT
ncbi:MAG: TolC family protein [Vicinamibacterales bacterium]